MKYNKPQNLKDMLELQKVLDSSINSARERTLEDIKMSMIAEIVEFNEETKNSHKTWKTKEYNKDKELEELTDVWFFMCQMINYQEEDGEIDVEEMDYDLLERILEVRTNNPPQEYLTRLIGRIAELNLEVYDVLEELINITNDYGYVKQDILNGYWKKWQKNMNRIGGEWN